MKLILYEAEQTLNDELTSNLQSWGFKVIEKKNSSSIIASIKADPEIGIVFLGSGLADRERLVPKLKALQNFVYVVSVTDDKSSTDEQHELSGPDLLVSKPFDYFRLKVQFFEIKKTIEYSTFCFQENRTSLANRKRQIINLETINKNFKASSSQFASEFSRFLQDIRFLNIPIEDSEIDLWLSLLEKAENLGLERLSDWLLGVLHLKYTQDSAIRFRGDLLWFHLPALIDSMELAYQNLQEFGFFNQGQVSESKNVLKGKHVLLVEDMQYNRMLLKKILQKHDCVIHEAENGQEAVEAWQKSNKIDVVIMDMNMPVMDGFEATKLIRKIEEEKSLERTPIIALTALAMRGDKEMCLEAGTDDYLPKPVEAQPLIRTCRKLLIGDDAYESMDRDVVSVPNIKKVLLKTDNQIYQFVFQSLMNLLEIDLKIKTDTKAVLNSILEESVDLIVLDSATDLELAYFISSSFKNHNVTVIRAKHDSAEYFPKTNSDNIQFPFSFDQILSVLQLFSEKTNQAVEDAEQLADADSLRTIKRQASLDEAVHKSNNQLAVWQKAFRKIGGDLVLSHQFNYHGKYGLILGDVAGHDIQSGYTASWFSGLVEGVWRQYSDPYHFLVNLNNRFDHETEEENKRFVCSLVILWDPIRQKLQYANAGIPGGIIIDKESGKSDSINWKGVPIGMFPDMDMFDHGTLEFKEGDRLIVATDGVLESIPREIISGLSESAIEKPAQQTLDAIVDFVTRSIEINDDLTIAVFEGKIPELPIKGFRKSINSDFKQVDSSVVDMGEYLEKHFPNKFDWQIISVAVREAIINAVEHGNKSEFDLPVDIDFEVNNDKLTVTVSDCGSGFDLASEKERLAKEGELRIHGRGIEMMENIGLSIKYLGGGIKIEFAGREEQ